MAGEGRAPAGHMGVGTYETCRGRGRGKGEE
jgi:hypothetical protein